MNKGGLQKTITIQGGSYTFRIHSLCIEPYRIYSIKGDHHLYICHNVLSEAEGKTRQNDTTTTE